MGVYRTTEKAITKARDRLISLKREAEGALDSAESRADEDRTQAMIIVGSMVSAAIIDAADIIAMEIAAHRNAVE